MAGVTIFLEDLSWNEAAERLAAGVIVLIPVGAAAKEHGRHLPLKTDAVLARELARRAAADMPVMIAPVIDFGHYPAFVEYAGSQSLSAETFIALVQEIVEGFIRQGARRIAILNTGVSTEAPLAIAQRRIFDRHDVRIAVADLRFLGRAADHVLEHPDGGHADERETSIMMAIDAALVRSPIARRSPDATGAAPGAESGAFRRPVRLSPDRPDSPDFSPDGATGQPWRASRAKGDALMDAIVDDLRRGLRQAFPDAFA